MNKKTFTFLFVFIFSTVFFSACSHQKNVAKSVNESGLEAKNAEISLTGVLSQNDTLYFISDGSGLIHEVDTYLVSFDEYIGKTVTVSGQYSGDTLFVTEISL